MHIAESIEFQVSLLVFVALAGYLLASRIGQPPYVVPVLMSVLTTLAAPTLVRILMIEAPAELQHGE